MSKKEGRANRPAIQSILKFVQQQQEDTRTERERRERERDGRGAYVNMEMKAASFSGLFYPKKYQRACMHACVSVGISPAGCSKELATR